MKTNKQNKIDRPIPEGWKIAEKNESLWQVGWLWQWSDVWNGWLRTDYRFTIKPGETPVEAYKRECDEPLWDFQIILEPEE